MNNQSHDSDVAAEELLARFIVFSKWVRGSDNTVKPEAFVPRDLELSVFRHLGITEEGIWKIGENVVVGVPPRNLYGRADLHASNVRDQSLAVHSSEPPKNHAVIVGWPLDKPAQKVIALELAKVSRYVSNPSLAW